LESLANEREAQREEILAEAGLPEIAARAAKDVRASQPKK
jgi:hypothetical protein